MPGLLWTEGTLQWGATSDGSAQLALGGSDPLFGGAYAHVAPYAFSELTATSTSSRVGCTSLFNSFPSAWADVGGDGLLDIATAMRVFPANKMIRRSSFQANCRFPSLNSAIVMGRRGRRRRPRRNRGKTAPTTAFSNGNGDLARASRLNVL